MHRDAADGNVFSSIVADGARIMGQHVGPELFGKC